MRSKPSSPRNIDPDPVYHSLLVTKIINRSMRHGKKTAAQKQVYKALEQIKNKSENDPIQTLETAMDNIRPQMEVRSRRIGGAAYQVPVPVRSSRRDSLAIRWLITAALSRPNTEYKTYADKLSAEIIEAVANAGSAVKKKMDTHRMAEANKAFAHFRW